MGGGEREVEKIRMEKEISMEKNIRMEEQETEVYRAGGQAGDS